MITAKQAQEKSYDKALLWCEEKMQDEIELALLKGQNWANKLFNANEVNPEQVKANLEMCGYKVELTNMSKQYGYKSEYGEIYNVTIRW